MNEFFSALNGYQASLAPVLSLFFLIFIRIGAAMAVLPALGEQLIPMRIRLITAIILALAIFPAVSAHITTTLGLSTFLPEVIIGLTIGLSLRFFIFALATAGTIIANTTSLSQLFATQGEEPQPALSQLLTMGALAIALGADLHLHIVAFLMMSYDIFSPGIWPDAGMVAEWSVAHGSRLLAISLMISMPFLIVSILYNLTLGVINKAMPQLMVTFIGAPALSLGGLALIALLSPVIIEVWLRLFENFITTPLGGAW